MSKDKIIRSTGKVADLRFVMVDATQTMNEQTLDDEINIEVDNFNRKVVNENFPGSYHGKNAIMLT